MRMKKGMKSWYSRLDFKVMKTLAKSKRSQVTIFIILAIVIVAGFSLFFVLRPQISAGTIPADFKPVEESYLSCIQDYTRNGISMLEQTGGYIYLPKFEPGNEFMPSSNMLDFSGTAVPFWYYISRNNIAKEQIPSKLGMEKQFEKYLNENIKCDFSSFLSRGFVINNGKIDSKVEILDGVVKVQVSSNLDVSLEDKSTRISSHSSEVNSKLGGFYNKALEIYNYEKSASFLESYGLDVLYSYAPVTDVVESCAPVVWNLESVKNDIKQGLENNFIMLKTNGNYFDKSKTDKYFVTTISGSDAVQFLYSSNWPTKIETTDKSGLMVAEPVGNQQGLGVMGFCYVPVHFVYDMAFPVLMQIYDDNEVFRFPVVAVIQGNKEKHALAGEYFSSTETKLCQNKDALVSVSTYDNSLEPIEAEISFDCFSESCDIGKTRVINGDSLLQDYFPRCVNGFISAEAQGYKTKRIMMSTNNENSANLILDKLYELNLNLRVSGQDSNDFALIYFESSDYSATVSWPEQKSISLADGFYNVSVYVYKNSSVTIPSSSTRKCVKSPKPGLLGIFGATTEQCFDLNIPEQIVSNVISGGGKSQIYTAEEELVKGNLIVDVPGIKLPSSIAELQNGYTLAEQNSVSLEFK